MRFFLVLLIAAAVVAVIYGGRSRSGSGPGATPTSAPSPPVESVTAREFRAAYDANEAAAAERFKGRRVRLTGKLIDIRTAPAGGGAMALHSDGERFVVAGFPEANKAQVAKLTRGQSITVDCTGADPLSGTPMANLCEVVEAERERPQTADPGDEARLQALREQMKRFPTRFDGDGFELAAANIAWTRRGRKLRAKAEILNGTTSKEDPATCMIRIVPVSKGDDEATIASDEAKAVTVTVRDVAPGKTVTAEWTFDLTAIPHAVGYEIVSCH